MMAAAEVGLEQVTKRILETVGNAMSFHDAFGYFEYFGPVHGKNFYVRRLLRQCDPPDARASANVQYAYRSFEFMELKVASQGLCGPIAHRKNALDELGEKFCAFGLLIHWRRWLARADAFGQLHPVRDDLAGHVLQKAAVIIGLTGHEKGGAFRR